MASGDLTATISTLSNLPCNVFDGVDDRIDIPHHASELGASPSNGFTLSAWIYPHSAGEGTAGRIFDKTTATGIRWRLTSTNRISLLVANGTDVACDNNMITFKAWQHVLVTCTAAGVVQHYVNGVASTAGGSTNATSGLTSTTPAGIGNGAGATTATFEGGIAKVKMWNRVLTAGEIARDYVDDLVRDGLIHYFKLGGDYSDYGSAGASATNSGSYAIDTLPNQIKADVDKLNVAATTDMQHMQALLNYERMNVVQMVKVVRA